MPNEDATHHLKNKNWTETVIFPLEKYSRANARPNILPEGTASTQTTSQTVNPVDWSHFTQPRLSLLLETAHVDSETLNKSGNLSLNRHQKIILKIMWDSNPQSQPLTSDLSAGPSNGPGVFELERINLTEVQESFGHLRMGDAPLKANCKDRVVAIRYATGHMAGSLMFNRIQIKLQTLVDCFKFIAIIETTCPCKMSSSTTSIGNTIPKMQTSQDPRKPTSPPPSNVIVPSGPPRSSQLQAVESNKTNTEPSKDFTKITEGLEPVNLAAPDLTPLPTSHQECETRKSPTPLQNENPPTSSSHFNTLPLEISDLNNLSDESLMTYVREIMMEPGFDSLVKHVKRLIPKE